jgi:hypothetical protein
MIAAGATPPSSWPIGIGTGGVGCGASCGHVRDRAALCGRRGLRRGFGGVDWRASTQQAGVTSSRACREVKVVGKPYEGQPHERFEVAGGGNQDVGPRRHSLTLPADGPPRRLLGLFLALFLWAAAHWRRWASETKSLLGVGMSRRMVKWLGIVGSIASVIGVALYFLPSNHSSAPSQSVHVPGSESIGVIAGRDVTVTVNSKQFKPVQSTDPRSHLLTGTWKGVHRQAAVNGQLIATGYTRMLESGSYSYSGELSFQSSNNGRLAEVILLGQSAGTWKLDGNKFAVTLTDIKTQPKVLKEEGRPDTDLSNPLTFPVHLLPKFEDTIPRGSSQEYEIIELTQSTLKVRGKDLKGREVIFEGIRQ